MTKICYTCKTEKSAEEYNICKSDKTGLASSCKLCSRANQKVFREKNKETLKQRRIELYTQDLEKNRAKNNLKRQKAKEKNPEKFVAYDHARWLKRKTIPGESTKAKERIKKYKNSHPDEIRKWKRENNQLRYHTDEVYKAKIKVSSQLRGVIRARLKKGEHKKKDEIIPLLECSATFYKEYIISQFIDNMSWEDYLDGKVVIDHIRPLCSFDLRESSEQAKCFHYLNTRPIWAADNSLKAKSDQIQSILRNI